MSIIKQGFAKRGNVVALCCWHDIVPDLGDLTGLTTFFVRLQHTVEDVCFVSICIVFVYCSHTLLYWVWLIWSCCNSKQDFVRLENFQRNSISFCFLPSMYETFTVHRYYVRMLYFTLVTWKLRYAIMLNPDLGIAIQTQVWRCIFCIQARTHLCKSMQVLHIHSTQ